MSARLFTPDELAQRWQLHRSQIYRLTRRGEIPFVKFGKYYRYPIEAIEAYENGEPIESLPQAGAGRRTRSA